MSSSAEKFEYQQDELKKRAKNKKPKTRKKITKQTFVPYLFVSPFIIVFLVFSLYPFINSILMSMESINFGQSKFIGLANYHRLITDPVFYKALWNVVQYTFWTILILVPLPLLLAILMNKDTTKFKSLFRSVFFLPVLTSTVIVGLIFKYAFAKEKSGVFNSWLHYIHIGPIDWLDNAGTGMLALVVICVWRWLGVNMIYFLSGLQGIPKDLYECADIDGANSWDKFKNITLPMVKPITTYVITISILGGFSLFNESYVYWGATSPGDIGTTFLTYIYKSAFSDGDFGYAATLGVAMFVIVVVINLIQVSIRGLFKEG
ncbi:sugar ABC transporter permease [Pullulanibacillus sp. KACC 23026]|uniref:carbohydrate ABC transporter permease n=1 Tax=Pullulanibacillus sp. KACC 23026 TaxID=3028315 RepID=UPI0023AEF345|nr:sugar ABC transporter permease [Pullulanibacillus sp. KACC 23026]WEG11094.1 sugar ABC transporter permease [Pullulanibacillus sp. KACC 23026]